MRMIRTLSSPEVFTHSLHFVKCVGREFTEGLNEDFTILQRRK